MVFWSDAVRPKITSAIDYCDVVVVENTGTVVRNLGGLEL